ncbi:MAG TPA: FtsX-like permease family protein [Acidimicrobiales bacterium]
MRLALRELRRRPGRFSVAGVILTLIALLLMFLGGLLDGLLGSATGAYRAQRADLVVYSATAQESLVRSRVPVDVRAAVEEVDGVDTAGGLGSIQLGARPGDDPEARDLVPTVLFGYELAPSGLPAEPPGPGTVIGDASLRSEGVDEGDTLLLGPQRTPVEVTGFVDDTRYSGQATLWGSLDTWREVAAANRPDQATAEAVQALVVRTDGAAPAAVADRIDSATGGATRTLTLAAATDGLPGVSEQRTTFNQIIGVTLVVALVVVALFFALITVERTALYGLLKAVGGSNGTLVAGLVTQAVVVTLVPAVVGVAATLALDAAIPPGALPFAAAPARLATNVALLLAAAVAGCAFSLRRVLRIDPASAIGAAS